MFDGVVRHVEHLGAETQLYVDACGMPVCVRQFGREAPSVGAAIRLSYDPSRVHLFETERRIRENGIA
jgi:ABC-type sugar transport system ATPase subunit